MGDAKITDRKITIELPLDTLQHAVEGMWAAGYYSVRMKVTDPATFAKAVERELNREKEDGTTRIHRMFDAAFIAAIENGAEGVEEHEEQNA